jgi:hypothetical protein
VPPRCHAVNACESLAAGGRARPLAQRATCEAEDGCPWTSCAPHPGRPIAAQPPVLAVELEAGLPLIQVHDRGDGFEKPARGSAAARRAAWRRSLPPTLPPDVKRSPRGQRESLRLPGAFSVVPGRIRTCDPRIRSGCQRHRALWGVLAKLQGYATQLRCSRRGSGLLVDHALTRSGLLRDSFDDGCP